MSLNQNQIEEVLPNMHCDSFLFLFIHNKILSLNWVFYISWGSGYTSRVSALFNHHVTTMTQNGQI